MSHFATHGGSLSPAEDALYRVVVTGGAASRGSLWPFGLLLLDAGPYLVVTLIATKIGLKADERWIR